MADSVAVLVAVSVALPPSPTLASLGDCFTGDSGRLLLPLLPMPLARRSSKFRTRNFFNGSTRLGAGVGDGNAVGARMAAPSLAPALKLILALAGMLAACLLGPGEAGSIEDPFPPSLFSSSVPSPSFSPPSPPPSPATLGFFGGDVVFDEVSEEALCPEADAGAAVVKDPLRGLGAVPEGGGLAAPL